VGALPEEACETRDAGRLVVALKEIVLDYSPSAHLLKRVIPGARRAGVSCFVSQVRSRIAATTAPYGRGSDRSGSERSVRIGASADRSGAFGSERSVRIGAARIGAERSDRSSADRSGAFGSEQRGSERSVSDRSSADRSGAFGSEQRGSERSARIGAARIGAATVSKRYFEYVRELLK